MANIRVINKPTANTDTIMYTATGSEVISISVANAWVDTACSVYIVPSADSPTSSNVLVPALVVKATNTVVLSYGITPMVNDKVYIKSVSGNVVFHLYGDW